MRRNPREINGSSPRSRWSSQALTGFIFSRQTLPSMNIFEKTSIGGMLDTLPAPSTSDTDQWGDVDRRMTPVGAELRRRRCPPASAHSRRNRRTRHDRRPMSETGRSRAGLPDLNVPVPSGGLPSRAMAWRLRSSRYAMRTAGRTPANHSSPAVSLSRPFACAASATHAGAAATRASLHAPISVAFSEGAAAQGRRHASSSSSGAAILGVTGRRYPLAGG